MRLFGYWRSSATYRVRIILALKGLAFDYTPVNLLDGEQRAADHLARNPQGLVPALLTDEGALLTQSLAIGEYLEESYPSPALLPGDAAARATMRAVAAVVACEAQPFMNLRVQKYLKHEAGLGDAARQAWLDHWAGGAATAVSALIAPFAGKFCMGDEPSLADAFVIPHLYAAARFGVDLSTNRRLLEIGDNAAAHPAFQQAHPDNQPDKPIP